MTCPFPMQIFFSDFMVLECICSLKDSVILNNYSFLYLVLRWYCWQWSSLHLLSGVKEALKWHILTISHDICFHTYAHVTYLERGSQATLSLAGLYSQRKIRASANKLCKSFKCRNTLLECFMVSSWIHPSQDDVCEKLLSACLPYNCACNARESKKLPD